jgi:hypothetical protein
MLRSFFLSQLKRKARLLRARSSSSSADERALGRRSREARRSQAKPGAAFEGKMMMMMSSHLGDRAPA